MANRGFAKMVNAPFTRMKPNLCPFCTFCVQPGGFARASGFDYVCAKKETIISRAHTEKGRCADFERTENTWVSQEDIDGEIESARDHQAYLQSRKAGQK